MISGELIKLCPFEKSHLELSKEWVNDPEIAKGVMRILPVSSHEHIQWYEHIITDKSRITFAVEAVKSQDHFGNIGLTNIDWIHRKGRLWIYLAKQHWGKGYAREAVSLLLTYAFNGLNLHRIYLDVGNFNQRAVELYKSLGFKEEGLLRDDRYLDGSYLDVIRMSILKDEF
jgi:RimJ/RimL family protein N-acetyltransferase